jgi:hypothetical protein
MKYTPPTDEQITEIVDNLEEPCLKSAVAYKAVSRARWPLAKGQISQLVGRLGINPFTINRAVMIVGLFKECPEVKAKWEPEILDGRVNLQTKANAIRREAENIWDARNRRAADIPVVESNQASQPRKARKAR